MNAIPDRRPDALAWLGLSEGADLVRRRALSPVEWTQALLDRIDSVGAPLDAFLHVARERALERAREAERERMSGAALGPLHGVPCAIKDIFETADMPTTAHSRVLLGHCKIGRAHV